VIRAYRLCSSRYAAHDGSGAAIRGGRWNPISSEVVYASDSRALAALEILVNYAPLPRDFALTELAISSGLVRTVSSSDLSAGWDAERPTNETVAIGSQWLTESDCAVLAVPSAVIPAEHNYVINARHPDFASIRFSLPTPFRFDSRLKV